MYESGTASVETTGTSVGAALGSQSISPLVMRHQAISTSTTLLASRLAPPRVDAEERKRRLEAGGLWIVGVGFVLAIISYFSLQGARTSLIVSARNDGLMGMVLFAGIAAVMVGASMAVYAIATLRSAIRQDWVAGKALKRWKKLWLCNGCGHTFEWELESSAIAAD